MLYPYSTYFLSSALLGGLSVGTFQHSDGHETLLIEPTVEQQDKENQRYKTV